MMKSNRDQSNEAYVDSGIDRLMIAHNEIINAWFEHWNSREISRIELAFEKSADLAEANKHVA
jgi:hypothetical protein